MLIGLALACEPRLLIADEPTTALDVMVQAQVLRLLEDLQERFGLATIFITHDLSTLASVCKRLAVMYAGRIVEQGPSREVFAGPTHPYTRALAGAFPVIGDQAFRMAPAGLPGDPPDPRHLPDGCPFHPRCPAAVEVCSSTPVELWPAGPDRAAACVHAPGSPGARMSETPARCSRSREPQGASSRAATAWPARSTAWTSQMKSGEIVALVGESGCGKTTLARSIIGLQRPLAGEVRFRGEALRYGRRSLREHRRAAQMIFQDPTGALNARQTIYEAVAEGVRIQKLPGNEEELVAEGLSRAGPAPAGAASSPATRTRSRAASASA